MSAMNHTRDADCARFPTNQQTNISFIGIKAAKISYLRDECIPGHLDRISHFRPQQRLRTTEVWTAPLLQHLYGSASLPMILQAKRNKAMVCKAMSRKRSEARGRRTHSCIHFSGPLARGLIRYLSSTSCSRRHKLPRYAYITEPDRKTI